MAPIAACCAAFTGMTWPLAARPAAPRCALTKFIVGEPMNSATKRLAGRV